MEDPKILVDIDFNPDNQLIIKPIEVKQNDPINIHPNFPQHPSLLYMAAPMGSGKTALIQYLLIEPYKQFFNKIFIFCPTLHQPSWKKIKLDYQRCYDHYTEEDFQKVLDEIKKDPDERCLIIVDDSTATNLFRRNNGISKFVFNHRHYPSPYTGTSLWIASHQYKTLPKNVRSVVKDIIIFKLRSNDELDEIMTDIRGSIPKKDFYKLYYACIADKYGFMYVAKESQDENGKDTRIRKNFNIIFKIQYITNNKNKDEMVIEEVNIDNT